MKNINSNNIIPLNDLKRRAICLKMAYKNDPHILINELNKVCSGTPYSFKHECGNFSFYRNGISIFSLETARIE